MFSDHLTTQLDNDCFFLSEPLERFAVFDDVDSLLLQARLQALWFMGGPHKFTVELSRRDQDG